VEIINSPKINSKHIKYLTILANHTVFKTSTDLSQQQDLVKLFKDESNVDIVTFIRKMFKKKWFVSDDSFTSSKIKKTNSISFFINWDLICSIIDMSKTNISRLKNNYPETYRLTLEKAKFMQALDFVKFSNPAKTINVYDNLILSELRSKNFESQKLLDLFCNLHVVLAQIPPITDDETMYDVESYKAILKESGINLPDDFVENMEIAIKLSVDKLYELASDVEAEIKKNN